ncbi:tail protein X [Sphingobium yanoikuyae]|uniref:tail protein X n=1 Tax=Sphingobium yanoikuyae TaxID=13690 RepID=UPI00242C5306|nr:tail protein X [Sphingobium yanoikuyae]
MAASSILTARSGDKLDLMLWRDLGLGPEHLTRVMDANPGLADLGEILPLGTVVTVPTIASPQITPTRPLIQLWS